MSNQELESGNFITQCINISLFDESCILGSSVSIISLILLGINIFAFIKMTKFYKKMNFENTIILLSIFQTIILQFVLITLYDIFFESFFLVQIFIISLIIRKFIILAGEPKTFFDKNGIFIILNILNLVIFLIYPIYLSILNGHHLYVKLFYRIFHAITVCILSYYCCFFINLTAKYKEDYIKSYYFLYEANIANNDIIDANVNQSNGSKSDSNINKGEVFYHKKKKQIRYLYVVNLLCAFVEIVFTITRNFILDDYYSNNDYQTIPIKIGGDVIYYIYLFVCFLNISVNFLCFYFFIRHQYNKDFKKYVKKPEKKIIDENYIERQEDVKKSDNPEVNAFLFNDSSAAKKKDEEQATVAVKVDDIDKVCFSDINMINNELLPDDFSK
jgi:hypothetical protein